MGVVYQVMLRVVRRIGDIPRRGFPTLRPNAFAFDKEWGTETSRIVWLTNPMSGNFVHGVRYEACNPDLCRWTIESAGIDYSQFDFIDVGCGKGRALLVASRFPFRRLVGIDYSRRLCRAACRNLKMHVDVERFEIVRSDAADYRFPRRNLFIFFYNPFGPHVLNRVLDNLKATAESHHVVVGWEGQLQHSLEDQSWLVRTASAKGVSVHSSRPVASRGASEMREPARSHGGG